jgi:ceramide glucosyltransferase
MSAFAQASYDLLWVLDATIAISPGTLGRMVDAFIDSPTSPHAFDNDLESTPLMADEIRKPPISGEVGLVHHVPFAVVHQKTWGSLIEQAFLNTTHAKMYLAIVSLYLSLSSLLLIIQNATAIESCVMGKSNMYSRDNIASLTSPSPTLQRSPDPPKGLAGFGPFMAEDNMIALSLWHELGLKHAMTSDVALDFIGSLTVQAYIARRARWIRVRRKMTLSATLAEPLTESIICGLYGSWAIARLIGASRPAIFIVHMIIWLLVDLRVKSSLETNIKNAGPPTSMIAFVTAWLMREMLALPIWLYAMLGDEVTWRGNRYKILASGEAVRIAAA